jgi:hypothetical protein
MIVSFAALIYVAAAARARYGILGSSRRPLRRKLESVS